MKKIIVYDDYNNVIPPPPRKTRCHRDGSPDFQPLRIKGELENN